MADYWKILERYWKDYFPPGISAKRGEDWLLQCFTLIYSRSLYPKLKSILAFWPLLGHWLYLNSVEEFRFGPGLSHNGTDHSS